MVKGNKIINENDKKHIEMLLSKDVKPELIAEIIGTSRTTVMRVKNGTHYLCRTIKEKSVEETPDIGEYKCVPPIDEEVTLKDVVRNQETIIQLLRQYLAEWRIS